MPKISLDQTVNKVDTPAQNSVFDNTLPLEVKIIIFSYLSLSELFKISQVSKRWKEETKDMKCLWKRFGMLSSQDGEFKQAIDRANSYNKPLKNETKSTTYIILTENPVLQNKLFNLPVPNPEFGAIPQAGNTFMLCNKSVDGRSTLIIKPKDDITSVIKSINATNMKVKKEKNSEHIFITFLEDKDQIKEYLDFLSSNVSFPHLLFFVVKEKDLKTFSALPKNTIALADDETHESFHHKVMDKKAELLCDKPKRSDCRIS